MTQKWIKCPICGKKVKGGTGLAQHRRFSHGPVQEAKTTPAIEVVEAVEVREWPELPAELRTSPEPPAPPAFNYETFTSDLTRFREAIPNALAELRKLREEALAHVQTIEGQIAEVERLASVGSAQRSAAG